MTLVVERTTHILRTCKIDMTSRGGFRWPERGHVAAADWREAAECGGGLHGFLEGEGDGALADWSPKARWLVARVERYIDLDGKVKAPEAWVEFVGTREEATTYLRSLGYRGAIIGIVLAGGDGSTLVGGDFSTLVGGDRSKITGGDVSRITGGKFSTLTGGHDSKITGGDGSRITGRTVSTLVGGDYSTLTGGDFSTLVGGHDSKIAGGDFSTLVGGFGSTLVGGDGSRITGGDGSKITGGHGSTLTLHHGDGTRRRAVTIYPGEDGIEPGVAYRLNGSGRPVRADDPRPVTDSGGV